MTSKRDLVGVIEAMHESFKTQHRQILYEHTRILDDYKAYFGEILSRLEYMKQEILDTMEEEKIPKVDLAKELSELSELISSAVKTCSQEIPGIISQLVSLQEDDGKVTE